MSLPASEVRVLTTIEESLMSRDPRLRSLFSIFTRLTWQEAMPAREQLRRTRWRPRPGAVLLIALALAVVGVVLAAVAVPAGSCSPTLRRQGVASAAVHPCMPTTSSGSPLP
jgi:Protein of unknown function (DUF3040)